MPACLPVVSFSSRYSSFFYSQECQPN
jgi:hypothetical protein